MGKNRTRESLIREIANTIIHKILTKYTNRSESVNFLNSETIEYRNNAKKISKIYNWNSEDKNYIERKALELIKIKLSNKYPDVKYSEQEAIDYLKEIINEII